jgi:hypothetical protein
MRLFIDSQALAGRFNEDEAVRSRYEQKCRLRQLRGLQTPLPEEVLDALDWLEAEQECRKTPCNGRQIA